MALLWPQRFELLLLAAAFLCGAVAAATLTRTQVRGGAGRRRRVWGRQAPSSGRGRARGAAPLLLGAGGPGEAQGSRVCGRDASAPTALCGSARRCAASQPGPRQRDESSGVT